MADNQLDPLIVKIWNVLDVNRLGDYICVCLTRVATTELETVGNDSCSIPEEEEGETLRHPKSPIQRILHLYFPLSILYQLYSNSRFSCITWICSIYISLSCYGTPELAFPIRTSLIEGSG
jgi:hypothetical protein